MFQAGNIKVVSNFVRKFTLGRWVKSWRVTFHNKRGRAELPRGVYYAGQRGSNF